MNRKWMCLVVGVVFLVACRMQAGINFDSAGVTAIKTNQTTKGEILKTFGEPKKRGIDSGFESWTYLYEKLSPSFHNLPTLDSKELYIVFHPDGRVLSFSYNTNMPEEYELVQKHPEKK